MAIFDEKRICLTKYGELAEKRRMGTFPEGKKDGEKKELGMLRLGTRKLTTKKDTKYEG
jgi:hypothetical protein